MPAKNKRENWPALGLQNRLLLLLLALGLTPLLSMTAVTVAVSSSGQTLMVLLPVLLFVAMTTCGVAWLMAARISRTFVVIAADLRALRDELCRGTTDLEAATQRLSRRCEKLRVTKIEDCVPPWN